MVFLRFFLFLGLTIVAKALEPSEAVKPSIVIEPSPAEPSVVQVPLNIEPIFAKPAVNPLDGVQSNKSVSENSMASPSQSEAHAISKLIMTLNISDLDDHGWEFENRTPVDTRRILFGKRSKPGKRPYMVYLQLTPKSAKAAKYRGWLCGGVVVHKNYVLTSAACVEDADRFYVVSGTTRYVDSANYKNDDCVCKHRRKVVWKCIPKNYKFDFQDSQKWSANDIAIVKVNKPFCFDEIEKGCEFAVKKVCYNNISRDLEKPGTKGWIAGWGSNGGFREGVYRRDDDQEAPKNAKCLQEAKVCIMDNDRCAKKWSKKFKDIIKEYMVCTKDIIKQMSEVCDKKYANCTFVESERRQESEAIEPPSKGELSIDVGRHLKDPEDYAARRFNSAGFCENDHGGPLIVKYGNKDRVIGVISACKIDPKTHSCHGPFLYTSVFVNRQFISCAINKDIEGCKRVFRAGITHDEWPVDWDGEDDGENKNDNSDNNNDKKDKDEDYAAASDDKDDKDDKDSGENSAEALRQSPDGKALRTDGAPAPNATVPDSDIKTGKADPLKP